MKARTSCILHLKLPLEVVTDDDVAVGTGYRVIAGLQGGPFQAPGQKMLTVLTRPQGTTGLSFWIG